MTGTLESLQTKVHKSHISWNQPLLHKVKHCLGPNKAANHKLVAINIKQLEMPI